MTTVEDPKAPDVETVKQLLKEDIVPSNPGTPTNVVDVSESSFYEDDALMDTVRNRSQLWLITNYSSLTRLMFVS